MPPKPHWHTISSNVCRADKIVVLDKGRIAETGSHDELLVNGAIYRRLHELRILMPAPR
jgi:ABC-type multidrug transport system fused ATPase/permease subunit